MPKICKTHRRRRAGEEDKTTQVRGALVAEGASGVEKRADTVRLHGAAYQARAVAGRRRRGLLGLEELLLGVGCLRLPVRVAKDGTEDRQRDRVRVDGAEGDSRGLNRREV